MITEFIKAFKRAYQEINYEKLVAKGQIKDLQNWYKKYADLVEKLEQIYNDLCSVYTNLPLIPRQDYVQKTLDLINKTPVYKYDVYHCYNHIKVELERTIDAMKQYYANKDYESMTNMYNKTCEYITNKIEQIINEE